MGYLIILSLNWMDFQMYPELQLFQRNFVMEVCRYSEMERRLQVIATEMRLNNIPMIERNIESCPAQPLNEMVQFEVGNNIILQI